MEKRFPDWITRPWGTGTAFETTKDLLGDLALCTVCQSAKCPNIGDCWRRRTATFMILGNACTRNCAFCAVRHGAPAAPGREEPRRVAEAVSRLGLGHAVITSVTRDDLPDGGAAHFAATIAAIRARCAGTTIEVLVPDFQGDTAALSRVLEARPDVFAHNVETVESLYGTLRGTEHAYGRALEVLRFASGHGAGALIKSGLMVGHGETEAEVDQTLRDLRDAGCEAVAIGQYLQPGPAQRPVAAFIPPEQFAAYEARAYALGFVHAVAAPLVRSSYRAEEALEARQQAIPSGR